MTTIQESPTIDQAGAVPYRYLDDRLQFCLITSSAGRWIFPKGRVEIGEPAAETAKREAHEEAGVTGRIDGDSLGCYETVKNGDLQRVELYLLEVTDTEDTWEEDSWRERRWETQDVAHKVLGEPLIHELLDVAAERAAKAA